LLNGNFVATQNLSGRVGGTLARLTLEQSKTLLTLCRTGRLYEIEDWIRAGKSIEVAAGARATPLQVAFETGFQSLTELLVRNTH
jgi:hypothetical protein